MSNLELADEEKAVLLRLVKQTIDTDRYPLSPRPIRSARSWRSWSRNRYGRSGHRLSSTPHQRRRQFNDGDVDGTASE
jgi:hypothetical protein